VDEDCDRRITADFYSSAEADIEKSGCSPVRGEWATRRRGESTLSGGTNGTYETHVTNGMPADRPISSHKSHSKSVNARCFRPFAHSPFRLSPFAQSPQRVLSFDFRACSVDQ
jgi:hypothetical protein